ncbi:MAG: (Fe-S)-binding protein, partial [Anaerolineaceae bacterium]|nr:(Fe-S)-binding protein [Anaerolineaceae bacterium]
FINSCTLCGLCGEVCPTDLDMGSAIREVRQTMVKIGKMPISAHDFALRDMAFSNSDRFALNLCADGSETCSYLFFPGCQLAASNPEYIPQLFQTLSSVLPKMGVMLRCCGAPADWSGEEKLFQKSIEELKNQWQALGKPKLVLACSSCNRIFKQFLPDAQTISIWEVFEQYHLFPKGLGDGKQFVIHDPCTSRYEAAWQNSARAGLDGMGVIYHELVMSRNLTECCGYGGVAWLAHPEMVHDIVQRRVAEDPADYLTYCVMCRDFFAAEGKPTLHLLDLIYGKDLNILATRKGPNYSQRHENRARVKQNMLKLLSGKEPYEVESFENYKLILTPEMQARIESRLILVEDIQKVIEHAEISGECFVNQENGHALAYFKPNLITYWVEYTQEDNAFRIFDAYSHRMDFEGGASQ